MKLSPLGSLIMAHLRPQQESNLDNIMHFDVRTSFSMYQAICKNEKKYKKELSEITVSTS